LGATHRLVDESTSDRALDKLLDTPVKPQVEQRIAELRASSEAFLDAALS